MRMFVIPSGYDGSGTIRITGREYHYLIRVLRLKKDDSFPGRDDKGNLFDLVIKEVTEAECILSAVPRDNTETSAPEIVLYQCVCKGKKMDLIIRQAAEIGVSRIIPVVSEFSIPRISEKDNSAKLDRWKKIIKEAEQQSGSAVNTEVVSPVMFDSIAGPEKNGGIGLFFHQEPLDYTSIHGYLSSSPERVSIVIGPEGGLSGNEIEYLLNSGYNPVFLKTNILRAETAAVYALAAVQTILLERDSWKMNQ